MFIVYKVTLNTYYQALNWLLLNFSMFVSH